MMAWLRNTFDRLFGKKHPKPAPTPVPTTLFDCAGLFLVLGDFSL